MPAPKKNKTTALLTRAYFQPSTFDAEKRTVLVTFATDTKVRRFDYTNNRYFDEVLSFAPGHMRTERLDSGAPLLDDHNYYGGVRSVLGVTESHEIKSNSAQAVVRFSKRAEVAPIMEDVQDGILPNISCGYRVHRYEMSVSENSNEMPIYTAVDWEPFEITLAPIPADPKAGTRSLDAGDGPELVLSNSNNNSSIFMKREQIIAMLQKRGIVIDPSISDEALEEQLTRALEAGNGSSGTPPKPEPAVNNDDAAQAATRAAAQAVSEERQRVSAITLATRSAGLSVEFGQNLIDNGETLDNSRALIIEELAKNDPNKGRSSVNVGNDRDESLRRNAESAALIQRSSPSLIKDIAEFDNDVMREAAKYRNWSLYDFAREACVRGGQSVDNLDKMEVVGRAFTMSTSDFPVLLEGTNRRTLLAAYRVIADTWKEFCSVGSVSDFRKYDRLRTGSIGILDKVLENGEFKNKNIGDGEKESVSIDTYGNLISITRQMIINDDLGAFTRIAAEIGRSAARTIETYVYALLKENNGLGPIMADGKTLFHTDHGNIATTAGIPTVILLDQMRQQMGLQMDKDKNDYLDIIPQISLTPLSLSGTFKVLNDAQYDPSVTNKFQVPNIVRGLFSKTIESPRLQGNAYYMFANPDLEPVIEVSFLNGQQNPVMESRQGWNVDGVEWKIRHDFGVDAVGYRGAIRNAGQ